ncbi:MAG: hypothetical protein IJM59_06430 [Proteobacteria bacterium]|nr:hypothetical protein [Pseudomonadota bacterium]
MMQFTNHTHKIMLLLMPIALGISSCDDGPTQTCCYYFSWSDAYISAIGNPEQNPRDLVYIDAYTVEEFAPKNDRSYTEYLNSGEYLCSIMPEMKGINYNYKANNDKDAMNVCAESIPMHSEMANKIKEAWDNCCYIMGKRVIFNKEESCRELDSNSESEAKSKCWEDLKAEEFKYLSCFRTYITRGECEYIIN